MVSTLYKEQTKELLYYCNSLYSKRIVAACMEEWSKRCGRQCVHETSIKG